MSEEEVAQQLLHKRKPIRDQVHRQTENAARAFHWVEQQFQTPRPIRLGDLLTIHELLTSGSDETDNVPGRLRESGHNVTVGSPLLGGVHRAPPGGGIIRGLVEQFIEFLNSARFKAQPVVVQALVAHFYFVTLHPFGNGNGRATRCIEAALLYAGGYNTYGFYSLSNYFYRNRDAYFVKLQQARTQYRYNLTEFLAFGLLGFCEELERINAYVRKRMHRLLYRELIRRCTERKVGQKRHLLNQREANLLHKLLDMSTPGDPFSAEPAQEVKLADLARESLAFYRGRSPRTLVRELVRLEELSFLALDNQEGGERRVLINFQAIARY